MTITSPAPRLQIEFKVRTPEFDESEHPRDRQGRFIETGAEVRIWGGGSGVVEKNVGGGRIEVRKADGSKVIVHRNYLTVTAGANGADPTDDVNEAEEIPVEEADPDAVEDPALADGEDVEGRPSRVQADGEEAPDHFVVGIMLGETVGDYTVGEYIDGPSSIDGWVVGVTGSGGPIVRTDDGKDWPLLPDAVMARNTEDEPSPPDGLFDDEEGTVADAARRARSAPETAEPPVAVRDLAPGDRILREDGTAVTVVETTDEVNGNVDVMVDAGDGTQPFAITRGIDDTFEHAPADAPAGSGRIEPKPEVPAPTPQPGPYDDPTALDDRGLDEAIRRFENSSNALSTEEGRRLYDGLVAERDGRSRRQPAEAAPEAAPEGVIDSVNPSGSGVFEEYASGREFRATAPLAPNMTTLAETEGVDPDEPVTLYRGVAEGDPDDGIRPGDFVTTNRQLAQDYAGTGEVVEMEGRYGDVLDDRDEPGGEEYIYRPAAAAPAPTDRETVQRFNEVTPETPDAEAEAAAANWERIEAEVMSWPLDDESIAALTPEERQQRIGRIDALLDSDVLNPDTRRRAETTRAAYDEPVTVQERVEDPGVPIPAPEDPEQRAEWEAGVAARREAGAGTMVGDAAPEGRTGERINDNLFVSPGDFVTDRDGDTYEVGQIAGDQVRLLGPNGRNAMILPRGFDNATSRTMRSATDEERATFDANRPTPAAQASAPEAPQFPDTPETTDPIELAERAGVDAYHRGEMAAPALNRTVVDLLDVNAPVGDPFNRSIMEAFQRGYENERTLELNALLDEEEGLDDEEELPSGAIGAAPSRGRETRITLPDGSVATRTSKSRRYTHAVVSVPATPEARKAAFERRAKDAEERADRYEQAANTGKVTGRDRRVGESFAANNPYGTHEWGLVGTEEQGRGPGRGHTYKGIAERGSATGETHLLYRDVPEGVEVLRRERDLDHKGEERGDPKPVVRIRDLLIADAHATAEGLRRQAAELREQGAQPDTGGYGVLRWSGTRENARKATAGDLSYEAELFGRTLDVVEVDADPDVEPDPDGEAAAARERQKVVDAGLDPERIKAVGDAFTSTAARLMKGDVVYTRENGYLVNKPDASLTQRTIAKMGYERRNGRYFNVINFTDGTSTPRPSGGTRVAHVPVPDRSETPAPSPGPEQREIPGLVDVSGRPNVEDMTDEELRAEAEGLDTSNIDEWLHALGGEGEDVKAIEADPRLIAMRERETAVGREMVAREPVSRRFNRNTVNGGVQFTLRPPIERNPGPRHTARFDATGAWTVYGPDGTAVDSGRGGNPGGAQAAVNASLDRFEPRMTRREAREVPVERFTFQNSEWVLYADDHATVGGQNVSEMGYEQARSQFEQLDGGTVESLREGQTPEGGATPFDPETDVRLAETQGLLASARDEGESDFRRVGLYNAAIEHINGLRSGMRDNTGVDLTPEENEALREWQTTLRAERDEFNRSRTPAPGPEPDVDMSNEGRLTRLEEQAAEANPTTGATGDPVRAATGIVGDHRVRVVRVGYDQSETRYEVTRAGGEMLTTRDRDEALRFIRGEEEAPDPDAPQPGVPRVTNPKAAADYIAALIGDPDIRDSVQAVLTPQTRAVNGIYGAEGMRNIERHPEADRLLPIVLTAQAGITTRRGGAGNRRVWDPDKAQAALTRLQAGDPTLPANAVGRRAAIEVLDMDAPIRLGQPAAQKRVEGEVDSISQATPFGVYVRIIDDNGEPHVQAMPADATVDLVGEPPPAPSPDGTDGGAPADHPAAAIANGNPEPITFRYVRNPNPSTTSGADQSGFGQDVEPAGRYLSVQGGDFVPQGWETGMVAFQKPLHMDWGPTMGDGYNDEGNWKRRLSAHYGGLTGQALADAVRADGYDAIMTNDPYGDNEVVDLSNGTAEVPEADQRIPLGQRLPDNTRVRARQPGVEQFVEGEMAGYDSQGMARVRYFNRRGEAVIGTFNPNYVERIEDEQAPTPPVIEPQTYEGPNGTLTTGTVIARDLRGATVLEELVSIGPQSVGIRANDGYMESYPLYGEGDLARVLDKYRPATEAETARFRGDDSDESLLGRVTTLPDMNAGMDEYETVEELTRAIKGIDDNLVGLSGDEYSEALRYRARLVGEVNRRNAEVPPAPVQPPDTVEPTTEPVNVADLNGGDVIATEDGLFTVVGKEWSDDDEWVLDVTDADGNPSTIFAPDRTTFERIDTTDGAPPVAPEPEQNPPDEVDRTSTVAGGNLIAGDRVWLGKDKVEVTDVVSNDEDTVLVTFRYADRGTVTMPFGREAIIDRADDPFLPDSSPLDKSVPTSRPVLYTYQRKNIVALGLDADGDPMVAEAARRIRLRQPLAAEHSAALAQRLADMSAMAGKAQRKRMLLRLAAANNAASIEAGGRGVDLPEMPNADRVTKARPSDLTIGDQIAFLGLRGAMMQGKVTNLRKMMGGRLTEVTFEGPDGESRTMLLSRNTDTYVLPDLPEPVVVPQPEDNLPEVVDLTRLRVGDKVFVSNPGHLMDDEQSRTEMTVVEVDNRLDENGVLAVVFDAHSPYSDEEEQRLVMTVEPGRHPDEVLRVARGAESADQPRDRNTPPLNPEEVTVDDVEVGDWVEWRSSNISNPARGIITEMVPVFKGYGAIESDERIGTKFQITSVSGGSSWHTVVGDNWNSGTRLIKGDQNTLLRREEQKRERKRYSQTIQASHGISQPLEQYNEMMHFRIVQNALQGGGIPDQFYDDAVNAAFDGTESTTDLDTDRLRAIGRMTTNLQTALSGESSGTAHAGVRDAAAQLAEQIVNDHHERMRRGLLDVQPTEPGQSRGAAGVALARGTFRPDNNWGPPIESRDVMALARGVVAAREAREAADLPDGGRDFTVPDLPEGTSLDVRMKAYKDRLSTRFGFTDQTVASFGEFNLDDLEAGKVPPIQSAIGRSADRSPDGGPGADTMAQLEVLRAAGADLRVEVEREMASLGAGEETITREDSKAAYDTYVEASRGRNAIYINIREEKAREAGYESWDALERVVYDRNDPRWAQAREDHRTVRDATANDPQMLAYDQSVSDLMAQYRSLNEQRAAMSSNIAKARAEATRRVLARVRSIGGVELKYNSAGRRKYDTTTNSLRNGETLKAMRYAETNYPTEWLDAMKSGKPPLAIGTTSRGFFQGGVWIIRLSKDDQRNNEGGWVPPRGRVATHELGHAMEAIKPELSKAEEAFLWSRTSTGEVGERKRKRTGKTDGSATFADEFKGSYSGKDYADGTHYELFTTGMESIFAGSDYVDEDYMNWMLGVLALL